MVLVTSAPEPVIYFKEKTTQVRDTRFCLKPVQMVQPRTDKRADAINVQVVRGKTNTFIQLDEDEARKIQLHGDSVLKKIQKLHKSLIWNFLVGRSFVDRLSKNKQPSEEINLDHDDNQEFDPINPKTWSEDSFDFVKSVLKANEFSFDGFCVLFCVENDQRDPDVDYDEVAWELEKSLIYHYVKAKPQIIMNEEAAMCRRGLDPVSRKSKTPGRKRSGYFIYLAYQLWDNITYDQMVGEAINRGVDLGLKKKQLVGSLNETKLPPQIDERLRKGVKDVREFMPREQLDLIDKIKDIQDPKSIDMLAQFVTLVQNGRPGDRSSGLLGLPQFLTFLNQTQDESSATHGGSSGEHGRRASSRLSSITSPRTTGAPKLSSGGSTLPRPNRKPSTSASQAPSISSRSTTPDTPRKNSNNKSVLSESHGRRPSSHTQSSLASIPSSGSASSTPETLRRQEHGPSLRSKAKSGDEAKRKSGLPKRATVTPTSTPSRGLPIPSAATRASPRPKTNNSGSLSVSPSASATNSPRKTGPPGEGRITREDLRRMNKSYPSGNKKPSSSFSRATIPMS